MDETRTAGHGWGTAATPVVDCVRLVCDCGQDLDCCAGRHCPRCGASTRHCGAPAEHLERGPLGWVA